jgi:hypothetical protein
MAPFFIPDSDRRGLWGAGADLRQGPVPIHLDGGVLLTVGTASETPYSDGTIGMKRYAEIGMGCGTPGIIWPFAGIPFLTFGSSRSRTIALAGTTNKPQQSWHLVPESLF